MIGADGNPAPNPDFFGSFVAQSIKFGLVLEDWSASVFDLEFKAGTAEAYPDPAFSYFPSKFSKYDILTLIRQSNFCTYGYLQLPITAAGNTFGRTMTGYRDKRQGYANLFKELSGTTATTIHVTIKNAKDAVVVEEDLPLTEVDE